MLIEQQKDFKYLIVLLTGCTPKQARLFFCDCGQIIFVMTCAADQGKS